MELVCGLDVGTSGAKAIAVDREGNVRARTERKFSRPPYVPEPGLSEQDAEAWWETGKECLLALSQELRGEEVIAIAVDSTSGTFVPVDGRGDPLIPALMYNDGRAEGLEGEVNEAAVELSEMLGYTFPPAFSLVKLLWLGRERPEVVKATYKFLHAADYLVGRLTGNFDSTDTSNALKSGVDLITGKWPRFIEEHLGLDLTKFPQVARPGEKIGEGSAEASGASGLRAGTPVVAGASDGTASFLASGAGKVGDWNITLGTTLVIRGISKELIRDPLGRFYCHRHPEGYWLPGGASNSGGEALKVTFGEERLADLDRSAAGYLPTGILVYPLVRRGERMPFVSGEAEGFVLGEAKSEGELYAGYLEGIALVAAWSIAEALALGADAGERFFISGGGGRGTTLARVIASALGKKLVKAKEPEAAMGSALLAGAWAWYDGSVSKAQANMVQEEEVIEPMEELVEPLRGKLEELKAECGKRGYL